MSKVGGTGVITGNYYIFTMFLSRIDITDSPQLISGLLRTVKLKRIYTKRI